MLLDEAGVQTNAKWLLAEGADSASMTRSMPLAKALDDCLVAYRMNGEMLRPEQGYPARLVVPGWEGNIWVKWLRRLKVGDEPWFAREETSKYTDLLESGMARKFTFVMDAKSVITSPSPQAPLRAKGFTVISGLAWSGRGKVKRVDVSLDGGRNWREAKIDGLVLDKAVRALLRRDRMERRGAAAAIARDRRNRLRAADQGGAAQVPRRELDLSQQRHPDLASQAATARSRMSKFHSLLTLALAGVSSFILGGAVVYLTWQPGRLASLRPAADVRATDVAKPPAERRRRLPSPSRNRSPKPEPKASAEPKSGSTSSSPSWNQKPEPKPPFEEKSIVLAKSATRVEAQGGAAGRAQDRLKPSQSALEVRSRRRPRWNPNPSPRPRT